MVFRLRLFSAFITVLICLNFGEVKSLDCAYWCGRDCKAERVYEKVCLDAESTCDCTRAASYEQLKALEGLIEDNRADSFSDLLGLVLGVTFFVVIVGIIGCCFICYRINELYLGAGHTGGVVSGGAIYQPSPSKLNCVDQPEGAGPPPLSYDTPTGAGPNPLTV